TNSPDIGIRPSTSSPRLTKNAVARSRSETVMPTWSNRLTWGMRTPLLAMCFGDEAVAAISTPIMLVDGQALSDRKARRDQQVHRTGDRLRRTARSRAFLVRRPGLRGAGRGRRRGDHRLAAGARRQEPAGTGATGVDVRPRPR